MRVKNTKETSDVWCGQTLVPYQEYDLQPTEIPTWQSSDKVIADLSSGALLIGTASGYKSTPAQAVSFLLETALEITKQPDPSPFATPTYRTKLNATAEVLTCEPGSTAEVLFQMTTERYASGGTLLVKNPEFGDYIYAEVEDENGIIPAPYRAALCEAHPVVAMYIEKQWVEIDGSGYTIQKIDTRPLTAKISAGLFLSLHYVAVNEGVARQVLVNYALAKKL